MRWRLIQFIVLFAIFLVFIVFNLENKCDISFGFTTFEEVPVFLTVFFSLMIGMICILPFVFIKSKNKNTPQKPPNPTGTRNCRFFEMFFMSSAIRILSKIFKSTAIVPVLKPGTTIVAPNKTPLIIFFI